jgi:hypothetical protein
MNITAFHITSFIIGFGIAVIILLLVRRNRLAADHSIWWLAVATTGIILSVYPRLIDRISRFLGVGYPPTLLITVCIALILVKILTMEMKQARQEQNLRRVVEKLAILERERDCSDRPSGQEDTGLQASPECRRE